MPTLVQYKKRCIQLAGASEAGASTKTIGASTSGAPWLPDDVLVQAIYDACNEVLGLIADAPDNDDRDALVATVYNLGSGVKIDLAALPKVGKIVGVRVASDPAPGSTDALYFACEADSPVAIRDYLLDKVDHPEVYELPHLSFSIANSRLDHTGTKACIDHIPASALGDPTKVPERYANLVIAIVMSQIPAGLAPTRVNGAQYFAQEAEVRRKYILINMPAPPVQPYTGD